MTTEVERLVGRLRGFDCSDALGNGDFSLLHEAAEEIERLHGTLAELAALVRGECPSLLNEDSGGCARLSMEIDDLLTPNN